VSISQACSFCFTVNDFALLKKVYSVTLKVHNEAIDVFF
jgi:hypothetical protein